MISRRSELTLVQHDNSRRSGYGSEPMGDDDQHRAKTLICDGFQNQLLGWNVERGSTLVHD
jgi:hypothetical protein